MNIYDIETKIYNNFYLREKDLNISFDCVTHNEIVHLRKLCARRLKHFVYNNIILSEKNQGKYDDLEHWKHFSDIMILLAKANQNKDLK